MTPRTALIKKTKVYVREELKDNDPSHDYYHAKGVRSMAFVLVLKEGLKHKSNTLLVMELAALLHDVKDHKYLGDENARAEAAREFLAKEGVDSDIMYRVARVVDGVSYTKEHCRGTPTTDGSDIPLELAIMQDTDRLCAMGATGICRAFAYSSARSIPIYDHNLPANTPEKESIINHFSEKLFKLKDMMKTESGKRLAEARHEFMGKFVEQFQHEYLCTI